MYGSLRWKAGFREELDKFVLAAELHAKTLPEHKDSIICPCVDCKNHLAWDDVAVIRSHLIMRGFVKDYTVWIHHGEKHGVVDDGDDLLDDNDEALDRLSQYSAELDAQMDQDYEGGVGDAGGWDGNHGEVGADNDGGAREGDEDDYDNLEEMLRHIGPEIIQRSAKGLENLERVKKASKETVYGVEKGCPTHWTLLRFVLELLILKATYGWSDCSFNDLLRLLSWLLPQPNSVPANTYQAKKVISPLTMGVEKIHACPNHCILFRGDTFKDMD